MAHSLRDMEIRPVQPAEYHELGELTVDAYRAVHDPEDLNAYAGELRNVADRAGHASVLVAVDTDGSVLGGVTYVPGPESPAAEFSMPDAAGIRTLAVRPRARGRGVGAALVNACIEEARAAGRAQVVLHSTRTMTAAHRLYRRLGFERDVSLDWAPVSDVLLQGFRLRLHDSAVPAD